MFNKTKFFKFQNILNKFQINNINNINHNQQNRKFPLFKFLAFSVSLLYVSYKFNQSTTYLDAEMKKKSNTYQILKQTQQIPEDFKEKDRIAVIYHNANDPIEDRYIINQINFRNGKLLAVFDGHGGHQMAEYASKKIKENLEKFIEENKKKYKTNDEIIHKALIQTFETIEKEFYDLAIEAYKKGNGRSATVGSCALVTLVFDDKIFTASLGDSKARLFKTSTSSKAGGLIPIKLSVTHNSDKQREQSRLFKEFEGESDIVVCKRPNNTSCYVKGRLQPTRVIIIYKIFSLLEIFI